MTIVVSNPVLTGTVQPQPGSQGADSGAASEGFAVLVGAIGADGAVEAGQPMPPAPAEADLAEWSDKLGLPFVAFFWPAPHDLSGPAPSVPDISVATTRPDLSAANHGGRAAADNAAPSGLALAWVLAPCDTAVASDTALPGALAPTVVPVRMVHVGRAVEAQDGLAEVVDHIPPSDPVDRQPLRPQWPDGLKAGTVETPIAAKMPLSSSPPLSPDARPIEEGQQSGPLVQPDSATGPIAPVGATGATGATGTQLPSETAESAGWISRLVGLARGRDASVGDSPEPVVTPDLSHRGSTAGPVWPVAAGEGAPPSPSITPPFLHHRPERPIGQVLRHMLGEAELREPGPKATEAREAKPGAPASVAAPVPLPTDAAGLLPLPAVKTRASDAVSVKPQPYLLSPDVTGDTDLEGQSNPRAVVGTDDPTAPAAGDPGAGLPKIGAGLKSGATVPHPIEGADRSAMTKGAADVSAPHVPVLTDVTNAMPVPANLKPPATPMEAPALADRPATRLQPETTAIAFDGQPALSGWAGPAGAAPTAPFAGAGLPGGGLPAMPQLVTQIAATLTHGAEGATEIALSPDELGHVRLTLERNLTDPDRMTVMISFDRPETLDLFRRHIDQLAEAIRASGYSSVDISFGQHGSFDQGQGPDGSDAPPDMLPGRREAPSPELAAAPPRAGGYSSLDLRL